jgi:hypothetical protein
MLSAPPRPEASVLRSPNGLLRTNLGTIQRPPEMEGKAEVSGKSIGLGTPRFPMPAHIMLPAAQIGLWNAFVRATSMSGAPGNTAKNGLKTARSIQNKHSRRELEHSASSSPRGVCPQCGIFRSA